MNLAAGTVYRIYYGLYGTDGKLQSVGTREITFDNTFRTELNIEGIQNGVDCKIFLLSGGSGFVPQCGAAQLLFRAQESN